MVINLKNSGNKFKFVAGCCLFFLVANFINGKYFLPMIVGWLIHETGHVVMGKIADVKLRPEIGLLGIGLKETRETHGLQESLLASGGVLFNLLWGIAAGLLGLEYYYEASMVLALVNLVPVLPLDGGKILRGLLCRRCSEMQVTRCLAYWGQVLAIVLTIAVFWFHLRLWLLILPVTVYLLAFADVRSGEYRLAKKVAGQYQS
ncbi:MAG: site-2 protease family protein [Bacillota bacterium]|jgi:stage IV sporulation protein FB